MTYSTVGLQASQLKFENDQTGDPPVTEISHQPECQYLHHSFEDEHGREEKIENLQSEL